MADEPTPDEIKLPTFYDSAVPKGLTAEEVAQTTETRRRIVKEELKKKVKWTNKRRFPYHISRQTIKNSH